MKTHLYSPTETQSIESLYAHFPFCESKCHYCDFFSLPEAQVQQSERVRIYAAIQRELKAYQGVLANSLKTVFLGGGTPSLVPLDIMREFVTSLPLDDASEVTMEANPSSISPEKARAWRSFGINRISMGVQALDDKRLTWLGRVHSKSKAFGALSILFEAGFKSVNTDYIVGVPGQTSSMIEDELSELLTRFPHIKHISAYLLTLKTANSKFKQLPPEDQQLAHLRKISEVLKKFGFEHYEISNFAKKGFRALHNENYWLGGAYLGIGPSAHSFWPGRNARTKNWASLGKYCALIEESGSPVEWSETLDPEQQRLEYLMLRLRRSQGLDFADYEKRFGRDLRRDRATWIALWTEKGLCVMENGRLKLTPDGFFLSDQILSNIS